MQPASIRWLQNSGEAAERLFDSAAREVLKLLFNLSRLWRNAQEVNNQASAVSSRPHAPLTRVLALLLFVFIAYEATAEAVHKHSNLVKKTDEAASSIGGANEEGTAANDSRQSGACLICQLHQNLFTSLFNAQPRLVAPPALIAYTTAQPTSYLSQMDAPRRGRAPPLASLL